MRGSIDRIDFIIRPQSCWIHFAVARSTTGHPKAGVDATNFDALLRPDPHCSCIGRSEREKPLREPNVTIATTGMIG